MSPHWLRLRASDNFYKNNLSDGNESENVYAPYLQPTNELNKRRNLYFLFKIQKLKVPRIKVYANLDSVVHVTLAQG